MSTLHLSADHAQHALQALAARSAGALRSVFAQLDAALSGRRTLRQLRALDDRTLMDIGLHRSEIESVAEFGRADWTRYLR